MTKQELIDTVHKRLGGAHAKEAVAEVANCLFAAMSDAIIETGDLSVRGFGTFSLSNRQARTGRNIHTGETIMVPAMKTIRFAAAKALKDGVNA